MDEALRRLADVAQAEDGLLVCYDADCRVRQLLHRNRSTLRRAPDMPGCSIHFEHPSTLTSGLRLNLETGRLASRF
ncbi:MAG: hypothetical protein CM1200mP29_13680 [Verrucomicrobiota bacterium]|nr:MAG: hypothetical protein CM1200mP29_13680 [Verrucomicrobiota bacterium]